jgi:GMP synthase (glutamine-hydrolysing)
VSAGAAVSTAATAVAPQGSPGRDIHAHRVLILDFGSQYTQLIARRVRELGVYCEILPWDITDADVRAFGARGVILSGGPESVTDAVPPKAPDAVWALGVPVLGICYGMQTMAAQLGGRVEPGAVKEFGYALVRARGHSALLRDIEDRVDAEGHGLLDVWMSHGDRVVDLPAGFKLIASTGDVPVAGMADESRGYYAVQFHPEVTHTLQGRALLERFVLEIAKAKPDWVMRDHIAEAVAKIREQVGSEEVILGLSGGVDSSVAAALIHRAIGDQLTCVFVDHGLLRLNEGAMVMDMFAGRLHAKVVHVDASEQFLGALKGVSEPEQKRKIIGREFVEVFQAEAKKLKQAKWLAQGTIYPDVIESAGAKTKKAHTIKSHHNVGGLPERMHMKLVEPLRELFKDEVRALGRELGLTEAFVGRHPFPGPGLAIRCPGAVTRDKLDILRKADAIYLDEIRKAGLYDVIWQAFAVLLPVRTVGVMGDGRTYDYVCALRAVTSVDGMTADFYPYDMAFLGRAATRIINEVKGVNRVVYDVTSKPPGTIEWE